MMLSCRASLLR